jgi:uncharacterized protein (UPF0335 family)
MIPSVDLKTLSAEQLRAILSQLEVIRAEQEDIHDNSRTLMYISKACGDVIGAEKMRTKSEDASHCAKNAKWAIEGINKLLVEKDPNAHL